MKSLFYNKYGRLVWTCTKNAKYEFGNATKAIRKGAVKAVLYDAEGKAIERTTYSNQST